MTDYRKLTDEQLTELNRKVRRSKCYEDDDGGLEDEQEETGIVE